MPQYLAIYGTRASAALRLTPGLSSQISPTIIGASTAALSPALGSQNAVLAHHHQADLLLLWNQAPGPLLVALAGHHWGHAAAACWGHN